MDRRRFFAALCALPFAGKALETLAAMVPERMRHYVVPVESFNAESFRRFMAEYRALQVEFFRIPPSQVGVIMPTDAYVEMVGDKQWPLGRTRLHRSPSKRRRRNNRARRAAWRRAQS